MRRYLSLVIIATLVIIFGTFIVLVVNNNPANELKENYEKSSEIKAKYQFVDNALVREVKDDPRDRLEVTIGERTKSNAIQGFINKLVKLTFAAGDDTGFTPKVKIARWDDEVNVAFEPKAIKSVPAKDKTLKFEGDKIRFATPDVDYFLYELPKDTTYPEGAFEYEVILKKKPDTNRVEFDIKTNGLDFFYQPELTAEEISQGALRPENVAGSYAIYTSENKLNYVGGKEYKAGKMGHIFRPRIEDANGDWVWGELNIADGILSVTIPQEFLDNAVYPIKHAAGLTFGYTTLGGTSSNSTALDVMASGKGAPAISGTTESLTIYSSSTETKDVYVGLYTDSTGPSALVSGSPKSNLAVAPWDASWKVFTMSGIKIAGGVNYWSALQTTLWITVYYDYLAGTNRYWDTSTAPAPGAGVWNDPFDQNSSSTAKYSMYTTYVPPIINLEKVDMEGIDIPAY